MARTLVSDCAKYLGLSPFENEHAAKAVQAFDADCRARYGDTAWNNTKAILLSAFQTPGTNLSELRNHRSV